MTESAVFLWYSEVTRTHTPPHVRCGLPLSLTWKPRPQAGDRLPEGASLLSPNLQPQSCPGASGNPARAAGRSRGRGWASPTSSPSLPDLAAGQLQPPPGRWAGSSAILVSRLHRSPASPPAPPTLAACAHLTRAQASRTQRPRARVRHPALPGLAPPALSERGLLALTTRTVVALKLHFQRHRWVRSPREASYGPREPGRTDWAARVMPRDPRAPDAASPDPSSRCLFLSLASLVHSWPRQAPSGC